MKKQRARKRQRKLLVAAEDHNAEFDLLSSLPEPLIHHVLSFLTLEDILEAHAVCKSWRRTFSSFPVLEFRYEDYWKTGEEYTRRNRKNFKRMWRLVDATMRRFQEQHLKIDKFGINYQFFEDRTDDYLSRIDQWAAIALENNAQKISIDLYWGFNRTVPPEPPSLHLSGPTDLLESSSLRELNLSGFQAGEFVSWRGLMSACLSLQSLSLFECHLKEVRISGLPNLKSFSITVCASTRLVEIQAPSLESFRFYSKRTGCVITVDHSPNLKSLTLKGVVEDDHWFRDFTSRFRQLQDLNVLFCESLTTIRISNPLIESVGIEDCPNLTDISIEAPELRLFDLCTSNWRLPSISMKNPPRNNPVVEVTVFPDKQPPPPDWSCKLREFLVGSCKSFSSLVLMKPSKSFSSLVLMEPSEGYAWELRSDIKYGWSGVIACNSMQLHLARRGVTQEELAKAVDGIDVKGLLWTPHPATVTVVPGSSGDDFLQLFCDKAAERQRCPEVDCTGYANKAKIIIVPGSCSN